MTRLFLVSAMTFCGGCSSASSATETFAEVLRLLDAEMGKVPIEEYITVIANSPVPGFRRTISCPGGGTLILTVTSPRSVEGSLFNVNANAQDLSVLGTCDLGGGSDDVDGGFVLEKRRQAGERLGSAEFDVAMMAKKKECSGQLSLVFEGDTGLIVGSDGKVCGRSVDSLDVDWVVPRFLGEEALP